jgi:hypothetical protein
MSWTSVLTVRSETCSFRRGGDPKLAKSSDAEVWGLTLLAMSEVPNFLAGMTPSLFTLQHFTQRARPTRRPPAIPCTGPTSSAADSRWQSAPAPAGRGDQRRNGVLSRLDTQIDRSGGNEERRRSRGGIAAVPCVVSPPAPIGHRRLIDPDHAGEFPEHETSTASAGAGLSKAGAWAAASTATRTRRVTPEFEVRTDSL